VLAGYRQPTPGGEVPLAWLEETPYELPQLPDHAGHQAISANRRGDVVGYAMLPGATVWFQGSEAFVAKRVRGHCDD
jgi:hypothetical protein